LAAAGRIALTYPNFRYYLAARFLTVLASEMQAVAVSWQIFAITHRPLDLGLVGLAQFLPGVLLFPVTGQTADRFPRKRILQICYCGFALCSVLFAALTRAGTTTLAPIYGVLLLNGVVRAFNAPTSQAFLPLLLPQEHFPNAVAWGASLFQSATIAGPMVGGLIYGWTGHPLPVFLIAASSYLLALSTMSLVHPIQSQTPRRTVSATAIGDGLRYIWHNKLVLGAVSLDLFAVLFGGAVALLPLYAGDILKIGTRGLGLLRSAPGAGAVIMALVVAHWPLKKHSGPALLWAVVGFGLCTIVFGLSRNVALSVAALVLLGACDMISIIVRTTLIQLSTPDEMRGRVSAVNMLFIGASNEVGQFESGLTAQWFGTVPAVVLGGVATLLVVAIWSRFGEFGAWLRNSAKETPDERNA
jgi:MFS family permease